MTHNVLPPVLQNLASLRKRIARRIRQALLELQQNLGKGQLVPVPVPVPMRSRCTSQQCPAQKLLRNGFYTARRFYASYLRNRTSNRLGEAPLADVLRHRFSAPSHFHLKLFAAFYARPSVSEMLKRNIARDHADRPVLRLRVRSVPAAIRLNVLLSMPYHNMVMDLAQHAAGNDMAGCYVQFDVQPLISVPDTTLMSGDVLSELLVSLKQFEKHMRDLQRDLARLAELGELPVRVLGSYIRVYFPNCDRERLEALLRERNIVLGVVVEDGEDALEFDAMDSSVALLLDLDLLSAYSLLPLASESVLESLSEEVWSDKMRAARPFKMERPLPLDLEPRSVQIVDDYYWA